MAGHLDCGDGVGSQRDGLLHDVVDVALFQQIVGVLIVGAEHAAVSILAGEQGHQCLQIPGGSALPDHDELAPLQLGDGVLHIMALVVGVDAGGDVGVEVVALKVRGVAVDLLMVGLGRHDLLHGLLVTVDGAHKVHHLRKALYPGMVIEAVDGPIVQNGPGLVQRRGGDAGGQHEPHVYRQVLCGLQHILDAIGAHDVSDLVGIRYHRGGSVRQDGLHELRGADQGAFQMNVGIQETGENDLAGAVHLRPALIASHAHDQTFRHSNVHGGQFIGEHVDKGGVFQHQIRRLPPGGGRDDPLLFQQLSVDLSSIAFRHSTTPSINLTEIGIAYSRHNKM